MSIRQRRTVSAWALLLVFLPMLLLSSLHVHEGADAGETTCTECVNHIPHAGHVSLQTIHTDNCVLCQFASLPFLTTEALVFTLLAVSTSVCLVGRPVFCLAGVGRVLLPRAPPVF